MIVNEFKRVNKQSNNIFLKKIRAFTSAQSKNLLYKVCQNKVILYLLAFVFISLHKKSHVLLVIGKKK